MLIKLLNIRERQKETNKTGKIKDKVIIYLFQVNQAFEYDRETKRHVKHVKQVREVGRVRQVRQVSKSKTLNMKV
jgi:hypothetical protein